MMVYVTYPEYESFFGKQLGYSTDHIVRVQRLREAVVMHVHERHVCGPLEVKL